MAFYLHKIRVQNVRHLSNFSIDLTDTTSPGCGPVHLLITGRNGSGKTSLLRAVWERLVELSSGEEPLTLVYRSATPDKTVLKAYYEASRKPNFIQPRTPGKPEIGIPDDLDESRSAAFIEFLVNLKVQRSLCRDEGNTAEAAKIDAWFESFVQILRNMFNDEGLTLEFNPRNYEFAIVSSRGQRSPMTHLADGYAALLDIVADLILKMQSEDSLIAAYDTPGIVLIDEVETHLHMELQSLVMPILTAIFPKIQFIVTTHSPLVLSSVSNAVAFDLETRKALDNADEYPYTSLAEGYFGVNEQPAHLLAQFYRLKELCSNDISEEETQERNELLARLEVSRSINPGMRAAVQQLKLRHNI